MASHQHHGRIARIPRPAPEAQRGSPETSRRRKMRKQSRKYIPKHAKKRVRKQHLNLNSRTTAIVAASILSATSVAGTAAFTATPAAASNWRSPTRQRSALRYRRSYARIARPVAAPTPEAFAALRKCESGGNYAINTGNGYYGAYQFSMSTWRSLGYSGRPSDATPEVQDQAAAQLQARSGWGQWPACSRAAGLR